MREELRKGYTWGFFSGEGVWMTPEAEKSMERLASNNLEWICLAVNCFQETFYSRNIFPMFGRTQTDEEVIFAIKKAKSLGLKVCLKPMVDCLDRSWRARINFPEQTTEYWDKWFNSYNAFMLHYARIAEKYDCEMLCTGCEMAGMDSQADRCRDMIAKVREVYHGTVMHNINHGDEFRFTWLDAVDVIGISAYYPVSTPDDHSKEQMMRVWADRREECRACHEKYNKPIMFAEIGVRNEQGCTEYPWDFHDRMDRPIDEDEQALFYETSMETMWEEDYFGGFFWWDWKAKLTPDDQIKTNRDFTIYGKKAEKVLAEWYAKDR